MELAGRVQADLGGIRAGGFVRLFTRQTRQTWSSLMGQTLCEAQGGGAV